MSTSKPNPHSLHHPHHSLLIGSLTGLIVGVTLQPLEILKTNLMINPSKKQKAQYNPFKTTIHVAKEVYRVDGIKGFWRGLFPALLKLTVSAGLYFSALSKLEETLKNMKLGKMKENSKHFISSAISRSLSGLLTTPIQVIRTRFEVIGFSKYKNTLDAFQQIYKQEGIKGFYSGVVATALRDAPFAGIYFTIYVKSKRYIEEKRGNMHVLLKTFVSGMAGGVVATLITNPFDIIRARMQYGFFVVDEKKRYRTVTDGFRKIYTNEGMTGFLKGLTPRLIRKPLSNSLTFVVFEAFHQMINKEEAF